MGRHADLRPITDQSNGHPGLQLNTQGPDLVDLAALENPTRLSDLVGLLEESTNPGSRMNEIFGIPRDQILAQGGVPGIPETEAFLFGDEHGISTGSIGYQGYAASKCI